MVKKLFRKREYIFGKKKVGKRFSLDRVISKRKRFFIGSAILTGFLVFISISPIDSRYLLTFILACLTYGLFVFGLWEDITKIEWLTLFSLPVFFSVSVAMWYFLLPVRWLTRIAVAVPYGIIIYFLFLSENINNVAAARTIQLLRVARTVGSFISLLTAFLFFWTIFSFDLAYYFNSLILFVFSFLLSVSFFWSFKLEEKFDKTVLWFGFFLALCIGEMAMILSFWPVGILMETLLLTTVFYAFMSVGENHFLARPVAKSVAVYSAGVLGVLVLMVLSTYWGR